MWRTSGSDGGHLQRGGDEHQKLAEEREQHPAIPGGVCIWDFGYGWCAPPWGLVLHKQCAAFVYAQASEILAMTGEQGAVGKRTRRGLGKTRHLGCPQNSRVSHHRD